MAHTSRHGAGGEVRILHLDSQTAGKERLWDWFGPLTPQSSLPVTHFHQGNKATTLKPVTDQVFKSMNLWGPLSSNHHTICESFNGC